MQCLVDELKWRGLLHQCTDEEGLRKHLAEGEARIYNGFDPSAPSLHLGNLIPIVSLIHAQRHGCTPIALLGGGTGLIGDPSGREEERQLLEVDVVESNVASQEEQLRRFLDDSGPTAAIYVNNAEWLSTLSFLEVLRDIGKHFSVNAMIAKDSVRRRLQDREQGISFTEFSYMILQSYDFLHLCRAYGCRVQAGGSDQWGNITAGIDLIRRMDGTEAYGYTLPLLTTASGQKFGKSEGNAIWLDAELTSPYAMYQYLIRVEDADVGTLLRYYTFLDREQIAELERTVETDASRREAQRVLAREVTRLVHGAGGLTHAERATEALFGGSLEDLTDSDLAEIFADVPSTTLPLARLSGGLAPVDLLVECGATRSRSEARRLVESGGVYLNGERVGDHSVVLGPAVLAGRATLVVRTGRRTHYLVRFE